MLFYNNSHSQTKADKSYLQTNPNFSGCMFLNPDYRGSIKIYNKPNGKILQSLRHDFKEENYISFNILKSDSGIFYIEAFDMYEKILVNGWISKSDRLVTCLRQPNLDLVLYEEAGYNKKQIAVLKPYYPEYLIVIDCDCKSKWMKIKTIYKGETYIGWIPPEKQCCNVYSTCS